MTRPEQSKQNKLNVPYNPRKGLHWVLINTASGKVSSSHSWLIAYAGIALINQDYQGLPSILPQAKTRKLLGANTLAIKKTRQGGTAITGTRPIRNIAREQAHEMLPWLFIKYGVRQKQGRFYVYSFYKWIEDSFEDILSEVYQEASRRDYDELINEPGKNYKARWWGEQSK